MPKSDLLTKEYLDKSLKASERHIIEAARKEFVTKGDIKTEIRASEKRIIRAVKTMMEIRDEELQGAHEDELDVVAGEKPAPTPWKSIPRRLKTVEQEVEKIKDKIGG